MINKDIEEQFDVFRKMRRLLNPTQRKLVSQLCFNLGKVNYCLKSIQKKGLVKFENFQKQSNKIKYLGYVITPKGIVERTKLTINFMKRKKKEYEELKKELERNK